ncbi:MAG TPA: hypothetical protein VF294_05970, partial [Polyangiaceae bacterium]
RHPPLATRHSPLEAPATRHSRRPLRTSVPIPPALPFQVGIRTWIWICAGVGFDAEGWVLWGVFGDHQ